MPDREKILSSIKRCGSNLEKINSVPLCQRLARSMKKRISPVSLRNNRCGVDPALAGLPRRGSR
jgi:hypothetical protein